MKDWILKTFFWFKTFAYILLLGFISGFATGQIVEIKPNKAAIEAYKQHFDNTYGKPDGYVPDSEELIRLIDDALI